MIGIGLAANITKFSHTGNGPVMWGALPLGPEDAGCASFEESQIPRGYQSDEHCPQDFLSLP
jgi:hypothetical protein